jgi:hypothetical protein
MGELDDTLVIYIQGDNGASAEGAEQELFNEMAIGCIADQLGPARCFSITDFIRINSGTKRPGGPMTDAEDRNAITDFMRFTGIARPEGGAVQTKGESFPAQLARSVKGI